MISGIKILLIHVQIVFMKFQIESHSNNVSINFQFNTLGMIQSTIITVENTMINSDAHYKQ